jgi:dTDP-glucose pyrophosphorylase
VAVGVVVPGVNAGVVKEAAVAVVYLEDVAVGELAVEDPEAVEVVEVVEDNQDLLTSVETPKEPGAMICLTDPVVGA